MTKLRFGGVFLFCATIWRLSSASHRHLTLTSRLFPTLTSGCAALACASALLIQGCAFGDRADFVSVPVPLSVPAQPAPTAQQRTAPTAPPRPMPSIRLAESAPVAAEESVAQPVEQGEASWYGAELHRRRTASGERFDMHAFTAAHPSLPFGTQVCVRSLVNGKVVRVRINDRGPHAANRIIDLSHAAAQSLGMLGLGIKSVALTVMEPEEEGCAPS